MAVFNLQLCHPLYKKRGDKKVHVAIVTCREKKYTISSIQSQGYTDKSKRH